MAKTLSKKNLMINFFVVFFLTLLSVYYLTKTDVLNSDSFAKISFSDILLVMLYFFVAMFLLGLVEFLVYRTFTEKLPVQRSYVNCLLGNLGSNVTPLKVAHFPLMFYVQHSFGVPFKDTVTGVVKCQIVYSFTSILVYLVVVITLAVSGQQVVVSGTVFPLFLIISLGLFFHIGVFLLTIVLAFNVKLQKWTLLTTCRIIKKFKKKFDEDKYIQEKERNLRLFREQITVIAKRFYAYLAPMFLYAIFMFMAESALYFSYLLITDGAFNLGEFYLFYLLTLASYYISNFIPVPGGAGTTEVITSMLFTGVMLNEYVGSTVILWRLSTYYLVIIVEVILLCFLPVFKKGFMNKTAKFVDFVSNKYE